MSGRVGGLRPSTEEGRCPEPLKGQTLEGKGPQNPSQDLKDLHAEEGWESSGGRGGKNEARGKVTACVPTLPRLWRRGGVGGAQALRGQGRATRASCRSRSFPCYICYHSSRRCTIPHSPHLHGCWALLLSRSCEHHQSHQRPLLHPEPIPQPTLGRAGPWPLAAKSKQQPESGEDSEAAFSKQGFKRHLRQNGCWQSAHADSWAPT